MNVEKNSLPDTVQFIIFPSPKSFPYFLDPYFSEGYICLYFFFYKQKVLKLIIIKIRGFYG